MVSNITSLTGNGLKDWLIQRVTAVYFAAYTLFLIVFFFSHPQLTYQQWHELFLQKWFILASVLALITMNLHAWIGIWTVTTDYIKCTVVRLSLQLVVALWLLLQFFWGLLIIWG